MVSDERNAHAIGTGHRTRHDIGLRPVHPHEIDVDRGQAVEVSVRGVDRRLTLFDRVVSDRNRALLAVVVAVAAQLAWLRKNWSPARRSRAE